MDCYNISRKQLEERCPFPLQIVPDWAAVNRLAARKVADLLRQNNQAGQETTLILPVGPLRYEPLADLCNREKIALDRLTLFMMDEYLQPDGRGPIPISHPLSFKSFMLNSFVARVDPALGLSEARLIFPQPDNLEDVNRRILDRGGVDLCYAGLWIAYTIPAQNHAPRRARAAGLALCGGGEHTD